MTVAQDIPRESAAPYGERMSLFAKLRVALGLSVPLAVESEMVGQQYAQVRAVAPILYLTISIIGIAAGFAAQGTFPILYQYVLPAILIAASFSRFLLWRHRGERVSEADARRYLRGTFIAAGALSFFGGLWCLGGYYETHETRRILAPIFMILSAFAISNCLASLPRAAIISLVSGLTPITLALLATNDLGLRAMGISIIVVAGLQCRLVMSKFAMLVNTLVLQHDMRVLADTDALTGLHNRRAFTAHLEGDIAATDVTDPFSVAMLDLDGFKPANDRFGHAAGDAVLMEVAIRLRALATSARCIARIGGDEFAIIFPAIMDKQLLKDRTEAVRAMLSLPYVVEDNVISISVSIGVADFPRDGSTVSGLLLAADRALYADKASRTRRGLSATG
jgi:diguanylate cyclase